MGAAPFLPTTRARVWGAPAPRHPRPEAPFGVFQLSQSLRAERWPPQVMARCTSINVFVALVALLAAASAAAPSALGDGTPNAVKWYNFTGDNTGSPYIAVHSGTTAIVDCGGFRSCENMVLQCFPGSSCEVRCRGWHSCGTFSLTCPETGGECVVDCSGKQSCTYLAVGCCKPGRCHLKCEEPSDCYPGGLSHNSKC
mmetsp:Transcript_173281/g.421490  ORF Transcript_173281/g.421490 Transcript_173281/m.421490 type:complete len:198 (-) Transcript_173281:222-815(-)